MRRNAVLISTHPEWVEAIERFEKDIELRKDRPSIEAPFKCYLYKTLGRKRTLFARAIQNYFNCGKVVGEFICDAIYPVSLTDLTPKTLYLLNCARVEICEAERYAKGKPLYAWHISDLKIYDKPRKLSEFRKPCIMPDEPYCPCCKHGRVTYSDDEIEYALYHGGYCDTCEWVCNNRVTRPPQSWCYVEGVEE